MFKKSKVLLLGLAALVMASCGDVASKLGGMKTDSPEVFEKAKELAKANFDPSKWKIVSVDWSEGIGKDELTGKVSSIRFYMIDNDGKAWQQRHKLRQRRQIQGPEGVSRARPGENRRGENNQSHRRREGNDTQGIQVQVAWPLLDEHL